MSDSSLYRVLNAFKNSFGANKHSDLGFSKGVGDNFWVFMRNHQFLMTSLLVVPFIAISLLIFQNSPFMVGNFNNSWAMLILFLFVWAFAFLMFVFAGLMMLEAVISLFKKDIDSTMEGFYRAFMSDMILKKRKEAFLAELGVDPHNYGTHQSKDGDLSFLELIKDFEITICSHNCFRYETKIADDLLSLYSMALLSGDKKFARRYIDDGAFYLINKMTRHFNVIEKDGETPKYSFGRLKVEQIEIEILD